MLVTPFADGMNLVAKEYVAARIDRRGPSSSRSSLVLRPELSHRAAGQSLRHRGRQELHRRGARDVEGEQEERMLLHRAVVSYATVERWAARSWADWPDAAAPSAHRRTRSRGTQPRLLVACDFDGTLSSIVREPDDAIAHREAMASLHRSPGSPRRTWRSSPAIFRGPLDQLARPATFHLVGSHGAELQSSATEAGRVEVADRLRELRSEIAQLVERSPRFRRLRRSPTGSPSTIATWHRALGSRPIDALDGPGVLPGVTIKLGKSVVDSPWSSRQGNRFGSPPRASCYGDLLFIGDDLTDEAVLCRPTGRRFGQSRHGPRPRFPFRRARR